MFLFCASQAAARKAQPLWQQLGFQAKINEKKNILEPKNSIFNILERNEEKKL